MKKPALNQHFLATTPNPGLSHSHKKQTDNNMPYAFDNVPVFVKDQAQRHSNSSRLNGIATRLFTMA